MKTTVNLSASFCFLDFLLIRCEFHIMHPNSTHLPAPHLSPLPLHTFIPKGNRKQKQKQRKHQNQQTEHHRTVEVEAAGVCLGIYQLVTKGSVRPFILSQKINGEMWRRRGRPGAEELGSNCSGRFQLYFLGPEQSFLAFR